MIDSLLPFLFAKLCVGYGLFLRLCFSVLILSSYGTAVTPKHSSLRPLLLLVVVVCCLVSVRSTFALRFPGGVARDYIIGFIFHASNVLCVRRVSAPPGIKTSKQRFYLALNQVFTSRYGMTYTPPFNERDIRYVPSRRRLLVQRILDFLVSGVVAYRLEQFDPLLPSDYMGPSGFLGRILEVPRREWMVRLYFALIGTFIPYLGLRSGYAFASSVALVCGDTPERWPPLFGSIKDAYTVRRWYS